MEPSALLAFSPCFENKKSAQRGSFWDGYPVDIRGSFARISRPKTSVRALKILEKQAFGRGYPWPEGADVQDPKGFPKNFGQKNFGLNFRSLLFCGHFCPIRGQSCDEAHRGLVGLSLVL